MLSNWILESQKRKPRQTLDPGPLRHVDNGLGDLGLRMVPCTDHSIDDMGRKREAQKDMSVRGRDTVGIETKGFFIPERWVFAIVNREVGTRR